MSMSEAGGCEALGSSGDYGKHTLKGAAMTEIITGKPCRNTGPTFPEIFKDF